MSSTIDKAEISITTTVNLFARADWLMGNAENFNINQPLPTSRDWKQIAMAHELFLINLELLRRKMGQEE